MALRKGFQESKGEIVVSIDADLSYDPHYINDLVETLRANRTSTLFSHHLICQAEVSKMFRFFAFMDQ